MRTRHVPYCAAALTAALALTTSASAKADTTDGQLLTSSNWAGYEVASSSSDESFSRVAGSWVQPKADCSTADGSAAFWVGLGGGGGGESTGLEQVGTEVDCSGGGEGEAHAWYELIPAAPVQLDVDIHAGDHISAWVSVDGNAVKVSLTNETTDKTVTKDLSTDNIDVSSAEWIAEAPSACTGDGGCTPVSLANFGDVTFTSASATASGHTGSISDSQWASAPLQLSAADGSSGGAAPTTLSDDGSSFGVSFQSSDVQTSEPDTGSSPYGDGGYGYGDGGYSDGSGGYGYSPDPGYGDGNPYGGGFGYGYYGG